MRSIKTKLILVVSIFVITLLTAVAYFMIDEKQRELTHDIYLRAQSFAELSVERVVTLEQTYLESESFVIFNREMQSLLHQNSDIENLSIVTYAGNLLYDQATESDRQYSGPQRTVTDMDELDRLRAINPSVEIVSPVHRVVYLKKKDNGDFAPVDANERPVDAVQDTERITTVIAPFDGKYAVVYTVSYANLDARIQATKEHILAIAAVGILLGILLAYFFASGIAHPLRVLKENVLLIAKGDFKRRVVVKSKDEVGVLAQSVNQMAADLEASVEARLYSARLSKELELAAEIQKQIIPSILPKVDGLDIAAGLIPADEIGGDGYDFIPVTKDKLLFYLGDVTGHGVPAGLVSAVANALIFSTAETWNLQKILIDVNRSLKAKTMPNMFMTILMAGWDGAKEKLHYVCAGHDPLIYYQAKTEKVSMMPSGGIALGMVPDVKPLLKEEVLDLKKGDVCVIYSDGIPEAWKNEKEMYGMVRLKQIVASAAHLSAEAIKNAIFSDVTEFRHHYKQADDMTVVVVKRV